MFAEVRGGNNLCGLLCLVVHVGLQCLCMEGFNVYMWRVGSVLYFGRISY